jgi:hypothetical protein
MTLTSTPRLAGADEDAELFPPRRAATACGEHEGHIHRVDAEFAS